MSMSPLVLASQSPRRQRLLAEADLRFRIIAPAEEAEDDRRHGESVEDYVSRLARQKFAHVRDQVAADEVVLTCDTVAECCDEVLGNDPSATGTVTLVGDDYTQAPLADALEWEGWDWPAAAYDAVAAIFIQFASPAQRPALFANMLRTLKPGGLLLLQGYTPKQLDYATGGPSAVENLYTEQLLLDAFVDHELCLLRTHESVVDEGAGHRGMSALVDVVVRKR